VNEDNFTEFEERLLRYKLLDCIKSQIDWIKQGMAEFFPPSTLLYFNSEELRTILSYKGNTSLDLEEWKRLSTYEDISPNSVNPLNLATDLVCSFSPCLPILEN